jgi:hypothetical protein
MYFKVCQERKKRDEKGGKGKGKKYYPGDHPAFKKLFTGVSWEEGRRTVECPSSLPFG